MTTPPAVSLGDGRVAVRSSGLTGLPGAAGQLGLGGPRPVVAVVGGAGNFDGRAMTALTSLFTGTIAAVIRERGAIAVDGGTDVGVMRLLGRARAEGEPFPLVGVAAVDTVRFPGHRGANPDAAPLEPHHSHFVLVPGAVWGDEAPYIARLATLLAGGHPSVTVLVNGGEISLEDCRLSVAEGRPVLALAGTGRVADLIAAAASQPAGCDPRLVELALSPLVRVIDVTDRPAAAAALHESLTA